MQTNKTNETMKDGERAAFEAWACNEYGAGDAHCLARRGDGYCFTGIDDAWSGWKARAASPQSAAKCQTCNDNGMIGGPSYYAPDEGGEPCPDCAAAPQAPLSDGHRAAIQECIDYLSPSAAQFADLAMGDSKHARCIRALRALLTQAPTERMSDAARDAEDAARYRWIRRDRTEDQTRVVLDIIIDNCEEYLDEAIDAARKAEIERSDSAGR